MTFPCATTVRKRSQPTSRPRAEALEGDSLDAMPRMRSVVATLAVVALCGTYVLVPERSIRMERHTDLRTSLTLAEDMPLLAQQRLTAPAQRHLSPPPSQGASASTGRCCSLPENTPLNVTLEHPVRMARPIRIIMPAGNFDGRFECDVPCEYSTSDPADGDVDVVVGEGAPPTVSARVRRKSGSRLATAARSMESSVNYPALRTLPQKVDVPMTTNLVASPVPVVYLTRSSIRKWGRVPPVWNASMLRATFATTNSAPSFGHVSPSARRSMASATFIAKNCRSRNGREELVKRLSALLPGGVDRPGRCLNTHPWPACADETGRIAKCGKHAVLRRYPFYLAFENSDEPDYVSEKVFHALEAGVLPVYAGAPNVAEFVPPGSVVELSAFGGSVEKLAAHLTSLLEHPAQYAAYFEWKSRGDLPEAFRRKFAFVQVHAKCRLCRWAWARKWGLAWDQRAQRPKPTTGARF